MHRLLPLAPLAVLAACHQDPAPVPAPTAAAESGYVAKVRALNAAQRAGVLMRAIDDAGKTCQKVVGEAPAEAQGTSAAWVATCSGGGQWVVVIADDGGATVVDAHDVARRQGG